eukprot:CAMPEP_0203954806 /NCGR_PEP_ID=MMETSP0359-20131031/87652_1 /ASSEMBLY_ACC=CAM_ASM_000338 /TAXON_ID=268821 /ORGANISM="Scrippsiella Hangoei, Strain SHTV-5" /LENGTH=208 /DNA_ID=CAMNT_0050888341 /DNA_START=69 /DNA_END=692 /DNA_ORIENTATION=+
MALSASTSPVLPPAAVHPGRPRRGGVRGRGGAGGGGLGAEVRASPPERARRAEDDSARPAAPLAAQREVAAAKCEPCPSQVRRGRSRGGKTMVAELRPLLLGRATRLEAAGTTRLVVEAEPGQEALEFARRGEYKPRSQQTLTAFRGKTMAAELGPLLLGRATRLEATGTRLVVAAERGQETLEAARRNEYLPRSQQSLTVCRGGLID